MIVLENVSKSFLNGVKEEEVIHDVNLRINKKEIFGLVGETGSGKSTILRMINGFIEPDKGKIYIMDRELNKDSKHQLVRDTSMIFQDFNLLGNLNVLDNVILPTKFRKGRKKDEIEKAREILSFVGLTDFEGAYIKTLSGGQKQRVAIARTLMTSPKIILCDEPTSALDDRMSYEVLKLLREINDKYDTTIVVVSHDISVIKSLCSRVAIIEDGRVVEVLSLNKNEIRPISYKEALISD